MKKVKQKKSKSLSKLEKIQKALKKAGFTIVAYSSSSLKDINCVRTTDISVIPTPIKNQKSN
jgi:ABC-type uncharacterized transport system substrate-binding protein